MAAAYNVAFEYEIANEVIASINGFISRNYDMPDDELPENVAAINSETQEIYEKLPLEEDYDKTVGYKNRLIELLKLLKSITPQPHR